MSRLGRNTASKGPQVYWTIKQEMGQAFTAGSIAAVIVIIALATITIIYVYTFPAKKATFSVDQSTLNPRIKNGASARIMSIATGRYLRRRPNVTGCTDITLEPEHTLVTADARRVDATLWKLSTCTSCPPSDIHEQNSNSLVDHAVDGKWCFHVAESDTSSHFLTFTRYSGNPAEPDFDGGRTVLLPYSEPFTRGTVDENGNPVILPENYLRSEFWFDLEIPPNYQGPNGAFRIITDAYKVGTSPGVVTKRMLTSSGTNGVYYNPSYDSENPPPISTGWTEQTCYEPKSTAYGEGNYAIFGAENVIHTFNSFFIELV